MRWTASGASQSTVHPPIANDRACNSRTDTSLLKRQTLSFGFRLPPSYELRERNTNAAASLAEADDDPLDDTLALLNPHHNSSWMSSVDSAYVSSESMDTPPKPRSKMAAFCLRYRILEFVSTVIVLVLALVFSMLPVHERTSPVFPHVFSTLFFVLD